jgi:BspA type Leucine rich repeat region (6 copies)
MKGKIIGLFVCMFLITTFFIVTLNMVSADQDGDYYYTVSNGNATITAYIGFGGNITIPSTLGGYPTVVIGDSAFFDCSTIISVIIPSSVTTIEAYAFLYCSSLTSVTIPNSVITIGFAALDYCSSLTAINVNETNPNYASVDGVLYNKTITTLLQWPGGKATVIFPGTVTTIGAFSFAHCSALISITIGNNVTTIENDAFYNCYTLTSVIILDSVTTIGDSAFFHCISLISLTIGNGVTTIENSAFHSCSALATVIIGNGVITIGNNAFAVCDSLTSVTIGKNVTTIGAGAFDNCHSLVSVTIPGSVTLIGNSAFDDCSTLTSITFLEYITPAVGFSWIENTPIEIRGHAYPASNFPTPGNNFYGLTMGAFIQENQPPIFGTSSPANGATNTPRPPAQLQITVTDLNNDPMDITFNWKNHTGTWMALQTYTGVGNNFYNYLTPITNEWIWGNTTYTWSVNATDGLSWTNKTYTFTTGGSRYDVNNNNIVNFQDAGLVWVHRTSLVPYDSLYDVNQDGQVNFQDAGLTWVNRD